MDLLLGRKTYEIFAAYWSYLTKTLFMAASRSCFKGDQEVRGFALGRGRYELAGLGAPARHRRRKAPAGRRRPQSCHPSSTELVHALLANDLVDAMTIFTVPVVLGGGKKRFADGSAPHAYKLTGSRVSSRAS